nr:ORF34 [Bracoviriform inaniti]
MRVNPKEFTLRDTVSLLRLFGIGILRSCSSGALITLELKSRVWRLVLSSHKTSSVLDVDRSTIGIEIANDDRCQLHLSPN